MVDDAASPGLVQHDLDEDAEHGEWEERHELEDLDGLGPEPLLQPPGPLQQQDPDDDGQGDEGEVERQGFD